MNKTIYKYELAVDAFTQTIIMPKGAKILHFGNQNNALMIWAEVDPSWVEETRFFRVLATGANNYPEDQKLSYVGTALFYDGAFVWHLYEVL